LGEIQSRGHRFSVDALVRGLLVIFVASATSGAMSRLLPGGVETLLGAFGSFYLPVAFAFVALHSAVHLGTKRAAVLLTIAFSIGLISELLGTAYGLVFGSYHYNLTPFYFGLVPLLTPFSWVVIIYVSYSLTNLILSGFGIRKPDSSSTTALVTLGLLVILSAIDGLAAVNLDLVLDPVAVAPQIAGWAWNNGGPYYGVPISNFVGWFSVTFLATIVFRFYEWVSPAPSQPRTQADFSAPVVYFMYFVIHGATALSIAHPEYVLVGLGTMMPFCVIPALLAFSQRIMRKTKAVE
jgi:putative membrane protein